MTTPNIYTTDLNIGYNPSARQALFHCSEAHELLYGGAAGGGKSHAMVMEAAARALEYDSRNNVPLDIFIFRRHYAELKDSIIKKAITFIPEEVAKYVEGAKEMRFKNGSTIKFRHFEHETDYTKYQGPDMHVLMIDELTQFTKFMFDWLMTRNRVTEGMNYTPVARFGSNPGGIGHGWVKQRFIVPHPKGGRHIIRTWDDSENDYMDHLVQYIPATVADNPYLTKKYKYDLNRLPDKALRDALRHGDWDTFAGQVFTEWVDNPDGYDTQQYTHVINPFPIPKDWRRFCSFDWGFSSPFSVGWWAIDPQGRLYRYSEWYGGTRNNEGIRIEPTEIAKEIITHEQTYEPGLQYLRVADPSIFDESKGESIARMMEREGVFFQKADNQRWAGKMQLHHRLAFNEYGFPGLYVFNTCRSFIRTMPNLVYDIKKVEDVDTDCEDHIYDETRYLLMEHPIQPKEYVPVKRREYNPFDDGRSRYN